MTCEPFPIDCTAMKMLQVDHPACDGVKRLFRIIKLLVDFGNELEAF